MATLPSSLPIMLYEASWLSVEVETKTKGVTNVHVLAVKQR